MRRRPGLDRVTYSHKTLAAWLNVADHCRRNFGIGELSGIDPLNVLVHRPRVHKCVMVYNRDAVVDVLIDIGHVADVIDGVVVVNVGDLNHSDPRISHVHVLNITRAGAIPGNKNFPRSKRKPSDRLGPNADSDAKARATDEGNQCRRVHRSNDNRSRDPAPAAFNESPSPIVEGRKAPRLIFYPGPSPRGNKCPMAVTVRRPISRDADRLPDVAILWVRAPAAIIIEVLVAGHVRRNIVAAADTVFAVIARLRPTSKIVGRLNVRDVIAELVGT